MPASSDYFLRLQEQEYFAIPEEVRERHLQSKIYSVDFNEFDELMQDECYAKLHKEYKKNKKALDERAYQLREIKRKNNK